MLPFELLVPSPLKVLIVSVLGSNPPGGTRDSQGKSQLNLLTSHGSAVSGAIAGCLHTWAWRHKRGGSESLGPARNSCLLLGLHTPDFLFVFK